MPRKSRKPKTTDRNPDLSDGQRSTLEVLQSGHLPPLPVLFFKNRNGSSAVAKLGDLIHGRYALHEVHGSAYPPQWTSLVFVDTLIWIKERVSYDRATRETIRRGVPTERC